MSVEQIRAALDTIDATPRVGFLGGLEDRLLAAWTDDGELEVSDVLTDDSGDAPRTWHPRRRWMLVAAATIVVLALGLLAVAAVQEPDSVQTDTVADTPAPSTNPATTSTVETPPVTATTSPLVTLTAALPTTTATLQTTASTTASSSSSAVPVSVRDMPKTTLDQAARKVLDEMASNERQLGTSYQAARIVSIRYVPANEPVANGTSSLDEPTWTVESEGTTLGCGRWCTVSIGVVVRQYSTETGRYRATSGSGTGSTAVCQADTINNGPIPSSEPGSRLPLCSDTPAPNVAATPGIPADEAGRIILNLLQTDLYTGYDDGSGYPPPWIVSVRLVPAGEPVQYSAPGDDAPQSDGAIVSDVPTWAVEWDGTALRPGTTSSTVNVGGVMTVDIATGEIVGSVYGPPI